MAMVRTFDIMFGADIEQHCVQFCSFMQCDIFVNYLSLLLWKYAV
jgi:hypothetical protein